MESLKLQHLVSRKYAVTDTDRLSLFNRIKAEHLFTSFDECLSYLRTAVYNQPFNPDNIMDARYNSYTLKINVIDESICSMIYEIYQQINRGDQSNLGYYRNILDDFYWEASSKYSRMSEKEKKECNFYEPLLIMCEKIMYLCTPEQERQEDKSKSLSYSYYALMYCLYKNSPEYSDYNRILENYYYKRICNEVLV